ncbi:hypothetical protein F5878DRAFT_666617 [Lentinula raphanica]|uniref:Uncharacterized protein n=1 Tax=Lentinula raphanica TaxID=153919 RepID=A0AA38NXE7_9AGAR|nr:hypothetical protein F5878DRAFT_666617 [Lentinula raphanica]
MGTPSSMDLSSLSSFKGFVRKRSRPIDDDVSMVTPQPTITRLDSDCSMLQLTALNTPTESDERPLKWRLKSREVADLPEEYKRNVNRLERDLSYRNTQLELQSKLADKQQEQIKQQEEHIKNQQEQIEDLEDKLQAKTMELGGSQSAALHFEHRYKMLEKAFEVEKLTRTSIEDKWTELHQEKFSRPAVFQRLQENAQIPRPFKSISYVSWLFERLFSA